MIFMINEKRNTLNDIEIMISNNKSYKKQLFDLIILQINIINS